MKIAIIAAIFCATPVLAPAAMAQFPETGGVSSQTGPTVKNAAAGTDATTARGRGMNSNSPAQNGASAHDNTHANNSTSPSDGPAGTPVPNGSKTVAGTSTTNAPGNGAAATAN